MFITSPDLSIPSLDFFGLDTAGKPSTTKSMADMLADYERQLRYNQMLKSRFLSLKAADSAGDLFGAMEELSSRLEEPMCLKKKTDPLFDSESKKYLSKSEIAAQNTVILALIDKLNDEIEELNTEELERERIAQLTGELRDLRMQRYAIREERAALIIQSWFRMKQGQRRYRKMREAAIAIQRFWRRNSVPKVMLSVSPMDINTL